MRFARPHRLATPIVASAALHGVAAAALLLAWPVPRPPEATAQIAVELAFAPSAEVSEPAPPAAPPAAEPPAPAEPLAAVEPPPPAELPTPVAPPLRPPPRPVLARPAARPPAAVVATAEPQATPAAPGPAALQSTAPAGPSSAWVRALDAWIDAHLDYPEDSRRRGEQGAVLVRLTVARDGRLVEFALLRGSGYDELDDATRTMFRNARLPAAPLESDPAQTTLNKPVRYVLR